mgnify:FL=1
MYKDVVKFIEACDQKQNLSNIDLYSHLIEEEYDEFLFSMNDEEALDACMDMIWVILGYCYMKGWNVDGAWNEVAKSNLAKIDSKTGKVLKSFDGKVMKPKGWKAPNLKPFLK